VRGTARQGVKGAVGRLFQRLADRLQHQLLHDEIGVGVGVAAVGGEARQHLGRGLSADASAACIGSRSIASAVQTQLGKVRKMPLHALIALVQIRCRFVFFTVSPF